jgi:hypothetical protein
MNFERYTHRGFWGTVYKSIDLLESWRFSFVLMKSLAFRRIMGAKGGMDVRYGVRLGETIPCDPCQSMPEYGLNLCTSSLNSEAEKAILRFNSILAFEMKLHVIAVFI